MKFLKTLVALATVAASAGALAGTSLGTVSPTNEYTIGGNAIAPLFGSNFFDAVTFSLGSSAFISGEAQGAGSTLRNTLLGGVYLYQDGNPTELGFDDNANDGFDFGSVAAGSYALIFAGTELNAANKGYYAGVLSVSAVPEPETYAMMLAGLGAIGFMARRRRAG